MQVYTDKNMSMREKVKSGSGVKKGGITCSQGPAKNNIVLASISRAHEQFIEMRLCGFCL